ncbi:hypothetical protein EC973_005220 [Apophysomyces ossiformis]|uniref:Uncharacterized protein n=1 Tax=Apophysomyces ossiformis TaxID=679940 RepID=A0A8H7BTI9_9FUNG|nr:hypothetical protein EC973_005220 [Apophysomyces ossiformis]
MPSEVFVDRVQPLPTMSLNRKRASSFSANRITTNSPQHTSRPSAPPVTPRKSPLRAASSLTNLVRTLPTHTTIPDDSSNIQSKASVARSRRQSLTRATVSSLAKVVPFPKEIKQSLEETHNDKTPRGTTRRRNSTMADIVTPSAPPPLASTVTKKNSKLAMIGQRVSKLPTADMPARHSTDRAFSWSAFGLLRSSSPSLRPRRDTQVSPMENKRIRQPVLQPTDLRNQAVRRHSLHSSLPVGRKQSKDLIVSPVHKEKQQTQACLSPVSPITPTEVSDDNAANQLFAKVEDGLHEPQTPLPQQRLLQHLHTPARRNSEPNVTCTKHSRWMENAGFMRRLKCEACNPAPKKKKTAIDGEEPMARPSSVMLVRRANSPPSSQEAALERLEDFYCNRKVRRISSEDGIMYCARSKVGRNVPSEAPRPGTCDLSEHANLVNGFSGSTSSSSTSTTTTAGSCSPTNATFDDSSMIDQRTLDSPTSPAPTTTTPTPLPPTKTSTYLPSITMPENENDSVILRTTTPNHDTPDKKSSIPDYAIDTNPQLPRHHDTFKRLMMCSEKLEMLSRELFGLNRSPRDPSSNKQGEDPYQERIRECEKLVKSQRCMLDEAEQILSILAHTRTATPCESRKQESFWKDSTLRARWKVSQWIGGGVGTGRIVGCESSVDGTYIVVVAGTSVTVEPQLLPKVTFFLH